MRLAGCDKRVLKGNYQVWVNHLLVEILPLDKKDKQKTKESSLTIKKRRLL